MSRQEFDPLAQKAQADALVEQSAQHLRALLHEAVSQLDPFPPFPGAFFTYAIEVDPDAASGDHGCVVLGPDGELYELVIGIDAPAPEEPSDPVTLRNEELKKLDLHPRDYLIYAYDALTRVVEILLEQRSG